MSNIGYCKYYGKFEKITINTRFNKTIRMRMTKDGIKIEIERKMKEENLE